MTPTEGSDKKSTKKPERPSPAGTGDHKPVLDAVIEAVSALSELAKSLRARAHEAAVAEQQAKAKKKGSRKDAKGTGKRDEGDPPRAAAAAADAKPAGDGVKRRLKKAWDELTAPEPPSDSRSDSPRA